MNRSRITKILAMAGIAAGMPLSSAFAADALNSGDTAWMIVATALVMMMTPAGLALFYGGMSRSKNLLNTFAMTFVSYCLASVIWMMWGYSLAFGTSKGGFVGGLDYFFLSGIGVDSLSGTIPTYVFLVFQMTFAGNPGQLFSIVATAAFSGVGTLIVIYITRAITGGLRVDQEEEIIGLDNAIHGERAFEIE